MWVGIKHNLGNIEMHLRAFQRNAPMMMSEVVHEFGDACFERSQELVPRKSNRLARSGYVFNDSPLYSEIGYTAPHAVPVEYGVRPHERVSTTGKRFRHRGQPAQPYLRPAVRETLARGDEIARGVFDRIAMRIMKIRAEKPE